jgi:hypothetical protein
VLLFLLCCFRSISPSFFYHVTLSLSHVVFKPCDILHTQQLPSLTRGHNGHFPRVCNPFSHSRGISVVQAQVLKVKLDMAGLKLGHRLLELHDLDYFIRILMSCVLSSCDSPFWGLWLYLISSGTKSGMARCDVIWKQQGRGQYHGQSFHLLLNLQVFFSTSLWQYLKQIVVWFKK